jgi:hypothetical protein
MTADYHEEEDREVGELYHYVSEYSPGHACDAYFLVVAADGTVEGLKYLCVACKTHHSGKCPHNGCLSLCPQHYNLNGDDERVL